MSDWRERSFLYSFIGARDVAGYLTPSRSVILYKLQDDPRGLVISREQWHYQTVVYDYQSIPVLWEEAAVFCPETPEDIRVLPDRLEAMARDEALLARKRRALQLLWARYGPDGFIYDIRRLLAGSGG